MRSRSEQNILQATRNSNLYRNTLNKVIRNAKQIYYQELFNNSKNDIKLTWQNIKKVLNTYSNKHAFPGRFEHNGSTLTNPIDIANAFNSYYINIGPSPANNMQSDPSEIENTMPLINIRESFFLTPTTEYEISRIINKLKPKLSTGIDEISCK